MALNTNCQNINSISANFPHWEDREKKHCFFLARPDSGIEPSLEYVLSREKAGIKGGKMRRLRKIKEGINPCLLPVINFKNKFFMLIIIRNKEVKLYAQFLFLNLL